MRKNKYCEEKGLLAIHSTVFCNKIKFQSSVRVVMFNILMYFSAMYDKTNQ